METKKRNGLHMPSKTLFDVIGLSLLATLCLFLPFATYTYKKVIYTISGFEFLMGKTVMKGTLIIHPEKVFYFSLGICVLGVVIALTFTKLKARLSGTLICLMGIMQVFLCIIFATRVPNILEGAKKIGVMYGNTIVLFLGLLFIVRGLHILYKQKVVTVLDFMIIPGMLYLLINNYLPMIGIFIAFKKVDYSVGILKSAWVGFDNFKYLFTTSDAFIITRNTLLYNLIFLILGNVLGIMVGIFLSEIFSKKLQKLYQTTILLPQLISIIIIAYIGFAFLSNEAGFINKSILGDANSINFYATKKYWPFILIFINLWKGLGYSSIIFLSAIVGIDRSLYEAAYIDGAGRMQQIKSIILPLLKPTIITLVLIQVGRIFYSDFGLFYQVPMNSGALYSVTQTIDTYVYRSLMQLNNISMASAASAYQSLVGFAIVLIVNGIVRKVDNDNALF